MNVVRGQDLSHRNHVAEVGHFSSFISTPPTVLLPSFSWCTLLVYSVGLINFFFSSSASVPVLSSPGYVYRVTTAGSLGGGGQLKRDNGSINSVSARSREQKA